MKENSTQYSIYEIYAVLWRDGYCFSSTMEVEADNISAAILKYAKQMVPDGFTAEVKSAKFVRLGKKKMAR